MATVELEQPIFVRSQLAEPATAATYDAIEEPSRALFLVPEGDTQEGTQEQLGPNQEVRKVNFKGRLGTMVLNLDRTVMHRVLTSSQLTDLEQFGFEPTPNPHITVLNFNNGRMIKAAIRDHRRKLAEIKREAEAIDWTWRSTGVFVPFHGRQQGRLKLVNIVHCPGIEEFNQRMEDNMPGLELERHPPHITLMKGPHELKQKNIIIGGVAIGRPLQTLDHLRPGYAA